MKILLSLPKELLVAMDDYCNGRQYERSEFVRELIRTKIYPKDISSTIPVEKIDKVENAVTLEKIPSESEKQEKLAKAKEALMNITKNSKVPMFCPKHQGSRIGDHYTCGCQI